MSEDRVERRVVITGIGAVTSIGIGVAEFLSGLREGRIGAKPISSFDTTGFEYANACEVTRFEPADCIEKLDPAGLGRASQFSVAAARMAVRDAGRPVADLRERRVLVSVGTTNGEARDFDRLSQLHIRDGRLDPNIARRTGAARLTSGIVRELGLTEVEAVTIPTACAAGNYAVGYGLDALRAGDVDVALCGGADALCRKTFAGFYRLGTIAPEVCRPFDADRRGILTGEGAGLLRAQPGSPGGPARGAEQRARLRREQRGARPRPSRGTGRGAGVSGGKHR